VRASGPSSCAVLSVPAIVSIFLDFDACSVIMTDSALDDDITVIRAEGSGGGADTPAAGWKGTIAVDMDDVLWCVRLMRCDCWGPG